MYDSGLSDWTAAKMGPRRDVHGELAKAVRAEGLHLGASSHRVEHNFFLDGGRQIESDINDPQFRSLLRSSPHLDGKQTNSADRLDVRQQRVPR